MKSKWFGILLVFIISNIASAHPTGSGKDEAAVKKSDYVLVKVNGSTVDDDSEEEDIELQDLRRDHRASQSVESKPLNYLTSPSSRSSSSSFSSSSSTGLADACDIKSVSPLKQPIGVWSRLHAALSQCFRGICTKLKH